MNRRKEGRCLVKGNDISTAVPQADHGEGLSLIPTLLWYRMKRRRGGCVCKMYQKLVVYSWTMLSTIESQPLVYRHFQLSLNQITLFSDSLP